MDFSHGKTLEISGKSLTSPGIKLQFWSGHPVDETLRNFYALYNCNFTVHMKDKPGSYGLLLRVLTHAQDRHASSVTPYVSLPISNPEEKGNIHKLVMEISKYNLKTGRNITGDWLYSEIDTVEELYQKKTTYARTIMPNRESLPVALKTAKGREVSYS